MTSIALLPTQASAENTGEGDHPDVDYTPLSVDPEQADADVKMGSDEQYVKPEGRRGDTVARVAALVSVGVFLIVTWVLVFTNNPTGLGWFFWHPVLQSLSVAHFTYGILTLQPTSQPTSKAAGLSRHQLIMLSLGLPAILLGTLAILINKRLHGYAHFVTWHGTFGIITLAWMLVQVALGGGSVWLNGRLFGGNPRAKHVWKYHRLSGYLLFPMLLITAHLGGAWSSWATERTARAVNVLAYTVAPVVLLTAVLVRVRFSKMQIF